jgi:hypothetical protein
MKRALFFLALTLAGAVPLFAQSSEIGIIVGGSRRFVDSGTLEENGTRLDSKFSFSNSAIDLFWAIPIDDDTYVKLKAGRIESPLSFEVPNSANPDSPFRRDAKGEVQHASVSVEYRFREPFGSSGLFGGLGFYRQSSDDPDLDATRDWGYHAGVNADFPLSKRYGVVVEGTYHWSRAAFRQRFLTVGAGLRVAF